jgi:hypothetical protein
MCDSKTVADSSPDEREKIIATLKLYNQAASLSHLQTVRSALLELKDQLRHTPPSDPNIAIETTMERLKTAL